MKHSLTQGQKTLPGVLAEPFVGDQNGQRKTAENSASISMVSNMLTFLDASPMTLFEGAPDESNDRAHFYQENFESIFSCVISANESIRHLAAGVAKSLFASDLFSSTVKSYKGLDSHPFKASFWRIRYDNV
jgi:neurofibromin 1